MTKSKHKFWTFYIAAWLIYSFCLGSVFLSVGLPLNWNLVLTIACNVLPVTLLGLLVIRICNRLIWSLRQKFVFIIIHFLSLVSFTALWCFLTLFFLSVTVYFQRGSWAFVRWDNFAILWQFFSGIMVYLTIASAVYVKQINESLQIEELRNNELKIQAARAESARAIAELKALRAQLNPHFLFNTLHSLMALVRTNAGTAEEAIERFALMLRYVLQAQSENKDVASDVSFADEWNFVQNYLELERLRLGDRLYVTTDIKPAAHDYVFPPFSLQPIVENAVKYAVAPRSEGGKIHISTQTDATDLLIKVRDNGAGIVNNGENQDGLGLRLVRESLFTRFGSAADLSTVNLPDQGFEVTIKIPRK